MSTTATRLITLILLLQRRPGQKAAELARELGVSVRTLHRYFGMLDEMGIPVYSERGPQGGFSLVRGYKLPPLVFSPEESAALYLGVNLAEEMWGSLYRAASRSALAKLENVLPDEQRHEVAWARRTLHATGMQRADLEALAPVLEMLRAACRERRCVSIRYQGSGQAGLTERIIRPYAMVHRWGWWYVVAFCELRQALRSFRVDRMSNVALLQQRFELPPDFNVQDYLQQETPPAETRVRMRFLPGYAHVAYENRLFWEDMQEQPDGAVDVEYASSDLIWAVSLAMGYGPLVEILAPEEARRMIAEWALKIYQQYQDGVDHGKD